MIGLRSHRGPMGDEALRERSAKEDRVDRLRDVTDVLLECVVPIPHHPIHLPFRAGDKTVNGYLHL
jgi:hypothetical protein